MTDMLELFGALKPEERAVKVGDVPTWDTGCTVREQAEKIVIEAVEVFAAAEWFASVKLTDDWDTHVEKNDAAGDIADECADVITATCNLLAMLGVEDARGIMAECAKRQRERGRL